MSEINTQEVNSRVLLGLTTVEEKGREEASKLR